MYVKLGFPNAAVAQHFMYDRLSKKRALSHMFKPCYVPFSLGPQIVGPLVIILCIRRGQGKS
jgi:hypothetical protein